MKTVAVFRVEKNANYTTMSNYHLRDQNLSLKAKGLLSLFLSLPEEWQYSVRGIASICKEGVDCIKSTLQELEKRGYLIRTQIRRADGRMGETEYVIYEQSQTDLFGEEATQPEEIPSIENPPAETSCAEDPHTGIPYTEEPDTELSQTEKPCAENPLTERSYAETSCTENPTQIKKERTNKERSNTELNKKRKKKQPERRQYGIYQNVFLSDQEKEALMKEYPHDYQKRIERLSEYMASSGKVYKNHLATIRSWARREEGKPTGKPYDPSNYHCSEGESL